MFYNILLTLGSFWFSHCCLLKSLGILHLAHSLHESGAIDPIWYLWPTLLVPNHVNLSAYGYGNRQYYLLCFCLFFLVKRDLIAMVKRRQADLDIGSLPVKGSLKTTVSLRQGKVSSLLEAAWLLVIKKVWCVNIFKGYSGFIFINFNMLAIGCHLRH